MSSLCNESFKRPSHPVVLVSEGLSFGQVLFQASHPPLVYRPSQRLAHEAPHQLQGAGAGQLLQNPDQVKGGGVVVQEVHRFGQALPGLEVDLQQAEEELLREVLASSSRGPPAVGFCGLLVFFLVDQNLQGCHVLPSPAQQDGFLHMEG